MSSSHHPHTALRRHPSKKTALRAARSAPVSKTALNKGIKAKPSKSDEDFSVDNFDDDDMSSSFLQYCAMCEKQIVIPNSSFLYCSESCRRKDARLHDGNPTLSLDLVMSPTSPPITEAGFAPRTILPPKMPTPRPLDPRIPPVAHDGKADLDPTEWKPADGGFDLNKPPSTMSWKPKLPHRPSSEAYSYLSQFHRSAPPTSSMLRSRGILSTPTSSSGTTVSDVAVEELVTPTFVTHTLVDLDTDREDVNSELSYEKKTILERNGAAKGSLIKLLKHGSLDINTAAVAI